MYLYLYLLKSFIYKAFIEIRYTNTLYFAILDILKKNDKINIGLHIMIDKLFKSIRYKLTAQNEDDIQNKFDIATFLV